MSASIILEKGCDAIQAAQAVAILQLKSAHGLSYRDIGNIIQREPQSVQQYVCSTTEMPASCWIKLVAFYPELSERVEYNLNEAEQDFWAHQRSLPLTTPAPKEQAA
jgi:hypothetical protein